jgi:hypothetical protein
MHKIIIVFIVLCILSSGASYIFYDGRIAELQNALIGKKFLLPPTSQEVNDWNERHHKLEIEAKERELQYLKNNQETPIENDDPILNHFFEYPAGHNPSPEVLEKQIKDLRDERNKLIYISLLLSFICTLALWAIVLHKKWNDTWR